jgi:hypothetical protein
MSNDDWGFAPPPYNTEQALLQLQRALRDCKLQARGNAFELKGRPVIELDRNTDSIDARLARRLVQSTPEWDRYTLKSAVDQRKLVDEVKRRLARWTDED